MTTHTPQTRSVPRCVRQLALIDLDDVRYHQLPLRHEERLQVIREERSKQRFPCESESEMIKKAKEVASCLTAIALYMLHS
jgi:hypothetical protein